MVIFPLAPDQITAQMWSNGARGNSIAYSMLCILHEVCACVSKHKKTSCRYDSQVYFLTALLGVTWRYRSSDHLIPYMPFPIGGPLD